MHIDFQHQEVRDLAWAIGSAPLPAADYPGGPTVSAHWCRLALWDRMPWLRLLDHHPEPLLEYLQARQERLLGHYFESLLAFWIEHWPHARLYASRLPVDEGGQRLGEFDLLLCDCPGPRYLHWEAAVKFYLRRDDGHGGYQWLGPNPRDRLEAKLERVYGHQLRLGQSGAGAAARQRFAPGPWQAEAFIKGYLFYPAEGPWQSAPEAPPGIAADHLRGWWTSAGRMAIPQSGGESRWQVLPRLQWLAGAYSRDEAPGWDRTTLMSALTSHFENCEEALLVAELGRDGDGVWRERSRGFVVASQWPQI